MPSGQRLFESLKSDYLLVLVHDDEFRSDALTKKHPEVVVFSGSSSSGNPKVSKAQAKAFMVRVIAHFHNDILTMRRQSSKVSKIRQEVSDSGKSGVPVEGEDDHDDERYIIQLTHFSSS